MKKLCLLVVCALCCLHSFAFEHVVSFSLYKTVTKEEFAEQMKKRHLPKGVVPVRYTVEIYDVTYYTKWHDGSTIKASGLFYVPRDAKKPCAELVYHHGTRMNKGRNAKLGGEENLCMGFAIDGYAVMQPDYIGLGNGDKFHLYQVAESEGQAAVDMILAVRELYDSVHVKTSGQLFLTGYSEGGHATLATQKLIQDKYADKIHVTASSPMSGAYDMTTSQGDLMFRSYSKPHYLPFLLRSYNEVYQFMPGDLNVIYKHPYDSLMPLLFDSKHSSNQIDKQLPQIPKDMIKDEFIQAFISDSTFPLRMELRANSLCEWKPEAPVQLCYCDSDEQVSPRNALAAYRAMKRLGAEHITMKDAGKNFSHNRCALVAVLYSKMYFDSFRRGSKYGGNGTVGQQIVAGLAKKLLAKGKLEHREGDGKHKEDEPQHKGG